MKGMLIPMNMRVTNEKFTDVLREVEISTMSSTNQCRKHNITEQIFLRCRTEFGGRNVSDAR